MKKKTSSTKTQREKDIDKHVVSQYNNQLQLSKNIDKIHANDQLLRQIAFYPAHPPRKETPAYKKAHDKLVKVEKRGCLICGVNIDTLKNKRVNKYGAKAMETHHHVVEWALAQAIDGDKFNTKLLPFLKKRHSDNPIYNKKFTKQDVLDWVDHSEDNLWVLCDV